MTNRFVRTQQASIKLTEYEAAAADVMKKRYGIKRAELYRQITNLIKEPNDYWQARAQEYFRLEQEFINADECISIAS